MIGSPVKRRIRFSFQTCLMLSLEILVLVFAAWRLAITVLPDRPQPAATSPQVNAVPPANLTSHDVLPTPTPDNSQPPRLIAFPGAQMSAPVIPAGRVNGTWETRHLGDSVGHLVGTSWMGDAGGNIVLAGHVESATGAPGPFAHLFEAKLGDLVVLRDGSQEERYQVTLIQEVDPNDVSWLAQDGRQRITMITCTEWDQKQKAYKGRLVVVAEPLVVTAQNPQ